MIETIWYKLNMTTNTTPAPYVASASSEYSGMGAWKAFNGTLANSDDRWRSTSQTNAWIKLDFGLSKPVNRVKITAPSSSTVLAGQPLEFFIEGSNDNNEWSRVVSVATTSFTASEVREFEFDVNANYRFYRLTPTKSQGSATYYNIGEIEYGFSFSNKILISLPNSEISTIKNNALVSIPSSSEENFIKYGMNKGDMVDLTVPLNNRSFIEQEYQPLGNGKVFRKSINTTKTPIKKATII
jgi:F5/8 type C domain.